MKDFSSTTPAIRTSRRPKRRRGSHTIAKHNLPVCMTTGKIRYRDHRQASDALSSTRWKRRLDERDGLESKRNETRSYPCRDCGGWHITSMATWVEPSPPRLPAA